jgi:hypothetical protein
MLPIQRILGERRNSADVVSSSMCDQLLTLTKL